MDVNEEVEGEGGQAMDVVQDEEGEGRGEEAPSR